MFFVWRLLGRWFWNRMSAGRWDTSLVMLPSSEQGPRDVLMDDHHVKTPTKSTWDYYKDISPPTVASFDLLVFCCK